MNSVFQFPLETEKFSFSAICASVNAMQQDQEAIFKSLYDGNIYLHRCLTLPEMLMQIVAVLSKCMAFNKCWTEVPHSYFSLDTEFWLLTGHPFTNSSTCLFKSRVVALEQWHFAGSQEIFESVLVGFTFLEKLHVLRMRIFPDSRTFSLWPWCSSFIKKNGFPI